MKILIVAMHGDVHSEAVIWALTSIGIEPTVWYWSNFPKIELATTRLSNGQRPNVKWKIWDKIHSAPYDVIWIRRKEKPQPIPGSHPDDIRTIQINSEAYIENILPYLAGQDTLWVNELDSELRCRSKLHQLVVASEVGFHVPETIISNDANEIRQFCREHNGKLIHKLFYPGAWENADGSKTIIRTSAVGLTELQSDFSLQSCPSIYQPLIDKAYELRVTVMGDNLISVKIDSQKNGPTVDWRYDSFDNKIDQITLPETIREKCFAICKRLGIRFGCIDLIVDISGKTIFLEVNSAGQFLWKEYQNPQLPMLSSFCSFITKDNLKKNDLNNLKYSNFIKSEAYIKISGENKKTSTHS